MVEFWERNPEALPGFEPIPDELDQRLYEFRVAEKLGIRPWNLLAVPAEIRPYLTAARVLVEVEALGWREQNAKKK